MKDNMKEKILEFLKEELEFKLDYEKLLEKPKVAGNGDFSFPCFILSKDLGKNPALISKELADKLSQNLPNFLFKVESSGPFLNFYLNLSYEANMVFKAFDDSSALKFDVGKKNIRKILIEYPSPNTNKSLHLGHVRNILIGNSLSLILKKIGHKVVRTNLNNDRGIALCKAMIGFDLFYKNETPSSLNLKSDEFVSMCYVKFGEEAAKNPKLNDDAQSMLFLWENGDKEVRNLWNKLLKWVFEGYKQTYSDFKLLKFDKEYYESQIYDKGKEIVLDALSRNVSGFGKEEDGAIFCDLSDKKFDKKYLLRKDGTTLYMTQDLYLAALKEKEFKCDKYVFIVGKEQEYHFNVLFEILDRIGFGGLDKNFHFAYGYVYDKDGKKFSSRKGKIIGADWLLNEVVSCAEKNLMKKDYNLSSKDEIKRRARIIGYSALAFSFLKINPLDDIKFDIEKALAFEGDTGPYVQYTYARIRSILSKALDLGVDSRKLNVKNINLDVLGEGESRLVKILKDYPLVLKDAGEKYKISAIANYLIKVCQAFNLFYQECPILKADTEEIRNIRLLLAKYTSQLLMDGLGLLDIETLDEM
ncbi:MAG: arginine--tRNA ligase [Nanoarchaeota archaeon]|nr:arginine--tRNA ligase [Nanoarchaeota archaeon]